ncbi:MAG TPA: DUF433 domain-containing protein [Gemmataceae bacterium]|nr:DUF433 domain-containing protein [Gemmataceae bacterium]
MTTSTEHIAKTPGICGGRACIAGHRIRVADIVVWHERRGYSPDEIVALFPGLALGDVHAALAYYFDHRSEIDADLEADDGLARQLSQTQPSKLRERLNG